MNIITFVKNEYADFGFNFRLYKKVYLGKNNWLYMIEYDDIEQEDNILRIIVSKDRNWLINRIRGFENNRSCNNGVALHDVPVDRWLLKDFDKNFKILA